MMAKLYGKELARFFAKNVKPGYAHLRDMDSDEWLASIGLKRVNAASDVFGAIGLLLAGCTIGLAAGMLLAPKQGTELRRQVVDKLRNVKQAASEKAGELRSQAGQFGSSGQAHA